MSSWGFVYCMSNDSMPGLFKIGYTTKTPQTRADELSAASGVPEPFEVLFYVETRKPVLVEAMVHEALYEYRSNPNREFFRVCDELISRTMQECSDGNGVMMESHCYQGIVMERRFLAEKAAASLESQGS